MVKESHKTGIFAAVAILSLILALATQPRRASTDATGAKSLVGKPLFPEFEDPKIAASLRITRFDESLGTLAEFEVRRDKQTGQWIIPSHAGYPADATAQMRDAATLFVGMEVLGVASERRADHSMFGVNEPDVNKLKVGDQGVGLLVKIQDAKDKNLASLIVGKEVKDQPGRRFVRIPSQDVVLDVKINMAALSTDFGNWIEKDLLKLSSFDVAELGVRDYSIVRNGESASLSRNYEADIAYDSTSSKWDLKRWVSMTEKQETPKTLGENEEVNATKLEEIKNALDQLEIVDVNRKPAGLSEDLKVDPKLINGQSPDVLSMYERGFYPQPVAGGGTEILSSSGELLVSLNDGVQYVLRFGNLVESRVTAEGKLSRSLMVTARLDESRFPPPELQPLPETIEDLKKLDAAASPPANDGTAPANVGAGEQPPVPPPAGTPPAADTPAPADAPPAVDPPVVAPPAAGDPPAAPVDPPAPAAEGTAPATTDPPKVAAGRPNAVRLVSTLQPPAAPQEPAAPAADAPAPPAEQPPAAATPPAEQPAVPAAAPAGEQPPAAAPKQETAEEMKERLELERERITKENQRKIEERKSRMEVAQQKVLELNSRFADWYYVIDEEMFKKLRLEQSQLAGPKQPAGGAAPGGVPGLPNGFQLPGIGAPGQ